MVARVTGAPAIQEPRAGAAGGPSVDLRSTQVAIQNIRERFRLLELALNNLVVPTESTSSSSSSSGNAGGPPGAIQYTDVGGGFAGSMALTWSATNQELTVVGDTYFYGDLYQDGVLLTFVTGIYADGVEHTGLVNLVAGSGITLAALTGNAIEISSAAAAGVNSLNTLQGDVTIQGDGSVTVSVLTGNVIELSASASAGVSSLNLLTGAVTIQGDGSVTVTILTGNVIELSSSASGGVTSLNSLIGAVTLQAGTNITITELTGNVLEIANSNGFGLIELYRADTSATTGPGIASGDVRWNNATQNAATQIFISHIDSTGVDIGLYLALIQPGTIFIIQDRDDQTRYQRFYVTSNTDNTTYFTIGVSPLDSAGGNLPNNHPIAVVFNITGQPGVTSLNTMVGDVTLVAGTNVTITPLTGNVLEISASGGGGGVTSLNTLTGPVTIQGDGTVIVTELTGNVIELSAAGGSGVSSLNYLTGPVTLRGIGIEVGFGTGNVIELRGSLFSYGSSPPDGALPGDRWVNADEGILYTWIDDGSSEQWVELATTGASVSYPIAIEQGGTGQITANAGLNALLPVQTGNAGKALFTDGTDTSWETVDTPTSGSFTPTLAPTTSGSLSGVTGTVNWTRIGNMVHFCGEAAWTGSSSPVGGLTVGNFPFTFASPQGACAVNGIGMLTQVDGWVVASAIPSTTTIIANQQTYAGGGGALNGFSTAGNINFSGVAMVS